MWTNRQNRLDKSMMISIDDGLQLLRKDLEMMYIGGNYE